MSAELTWQGVDGDGLGEVDGLFSSIKKTAGKIAPIALPVIGAVAAPFTGGASLAVAAVGTAALQAKKQKTAQKKAVKAQEAAMSSAYGLDSYLTLGQGLLPGHTLVPGQSQNLVPVQNPTTGEITYVPAETGFFAEYKIPLFIGGAVVLGGIVLYLWRK